MKKNLSRSTVASNSTSITSTTSQSFNYPYHNNNPRRNNSLPVVNAINPIQTPFQHNKPVIISSRGSAGTSPKNIKSCSEFDEPEPESELESSKSTKSSSEPSSRKRTLTQEHKHLPPTCLKEIQEKDGKNGAKDNHNDKDN
ncbi:7889_t:CDS:2 [Entrophospora sp. SA101]|nr:14589_t:CDS:2 [Entrophospora sp. SA101]CAJ0918042.1 7889_t:CDS:2 [Entrophospora sp. SA101]